MKSKQVIEVLERMKYQENEQIKYCEKKLVEDKSEILNFESEKNEMLIQECNEDIQALDHAITCVGAIEQIKWERDIAISQLNELGYQFGEKIWREFNLDNEELQDHYFYLVAHKDYGIPMTAKWHQDCPPTFQVYIGGGKCDEYIDELENREDKKITHWCKLPNLPKADKE